MQNDDVIWSLIGNKNFCSYKAETRRENAGFCRNRFNVTGLCNRQSCPLANSRYATILEREDGVLYLYMKTIERAHTPSQLWERVRLSNSYEQALAQVSKRLKYWPAFLVHCAKQRLTKMVEYLERKRKLRLQPQPELVPIKKKTERRERVREQRALASAQLERSIEGELAQRLQRGAYGDLYAQGQLDMEQVHEVDELEQQAEALANGKAQALYEVESESEAASEYEMEEEWDDELSADAETDDIEEVHRAHEQSGRHFDFDDDSDIEDAVRSDADEDAARAVLQRRARHRRADRSGVPDGETARRRRSRRVEWEVEHERENN